MFTQTMSFDPRGFNALFSPHYLNNPFKYFNINEGKWAIRLPDGNVLVYDNGVIRTMTFNTDLHKLVMGNVDELATRLLTIMNSHPALNEVANFPNVEVHSIGDVFVVPIDLEFMFFVVKDGNNWLDLIFNGTSMTNERYAICYNNRISNIATHSGDLTSNIGTLHHVKINPNLRDGVISVVGYTKKTIMSFGVKRPLLVVVNRRDQVLHLIPIPVAEAMVGNHATGVTVTHCVCVGNNLIFTVVPPITERGNQLDTSNFNSPIVWEMYDASYHNAVREVPHPVVPEIANTPHEESTETSDTKEVDTLTTPYVQYLQQGCKPLNITSMCIVLTDKGIMITTNDKVQPAEPLIIQMPITECKGTVQLLGGIPSEIPKFNVGLRIDHYNGPVSPDVASSSINLLNGCIVILHTKMTENINNTLVTLDRSILKAYGPQTVVLAEIDDKFYYYRGILPGLMTKKLNLGVDVSDILNNIGVYTNTKEYSINPKNYVKGSELIWNGDNYVTVDSVPKIISEMNIVEQVQDVWMMMEQLSVCLNSQQLSAITDNIHDVITHLIEVRTKPMIDQLKDLTRQSQEIVIKMFNGNKEAQVQLQEIAKQIGRVKHVIRHATNELDELMKIAVEVQSQRATSSIATDWKRLERQKKISGNVKATQDITPEQLMDKISDIALWGVMRAEPGVQLLLNEASKGPNATIPLLLTQGVQTVHTINMPLLDGITSTCMIQLSKAGHLLQPNIIGDKATDMVIQPVPDGQVSAMLIPILDKFTQMTNWKFGMLSVIDMANDTEVAFWRIKLRAVFANAVNFRGITGQTKDLAYILIKMLLDYGYELAKNISDQGDFEDNTRVLLRAVVGWIMTTACSGANPIMPILAELATGKVSQAKNSDLWAIEPLAEIFNKACYNDVSLFNQGLKHFVIKYFYHLMIGATDPLRKNIKQGKKEQLAQIHKRHEITLPWLRTVVSWTLNHLFRMTENWKPEYEDTLVPIATRLLKLYPANGLPQTHYLVRSYITFLQHLTNKTALLFQDDDLTHGPSTILTQIILSSIVRVAKRDMWMDQDEFQKMCKTFKAQLMKQYPVGSEQAKKRIPWSAFVKIMPKEQLVDDVMPIQVIIDYKHQQEEIEQVIKYIMTGETGAGGVPIKINTTIAVDTNDEITELVNKTQTVIPLVNFIQGGNYEQLNAPLHHLLPIINRSGININSWRRVARILLLGWRDPVVAEQCAIVSLNDI